MSTYFHKQYLEYFNKFLEQLKVFFVDANSTLSSTQLLSDYDKLKLGSNFVNNMTSENFNLFIDTKIKVFSHKLDSTKLLSENFFGSKLTLKQMLNNQTSEIKKTVWAYLHVLYLYSSLCAPVEEHKLEQLERLYGLLQIDNPSLLNAAKSDATQKIYDLLNVKVNTDTQGMIDDIVKSFDPLLDGSQSNPMASIMQISQVISTKYADKINNGEIELEKLMDSIKTKIPGMEDVLKNFANVKKSQPKEKVIINENYSTSDISVGENEDEKKSNFNIGNILKAVDSSGFMPGNKPNENMPDLSAMFNSTDGSNKMPNINDMLKLMNSMQDPNLKFDQGELDKLMGSMNLNLK